jgi:hypothetical protein
MKKITLFLFFGLFLTAFSCTKDQNLAEIATSENGVSGSITRFAVHQNYLYGLNLNEVLTYDLADADHPKLVNRLRTDYGLETITIYDGNVYLGSTTSLYILDISNPATPNILSQTPRLQNFSGCDPVAVKGDYAYSTIKIIENICGNTSSSSALIVFDVKDKTNPRQISSYPLNIPNGLSIKDNYLFICDEGSDKLEIFDISNPLEMKLTDFSFGITDPVDLIVSGDKMIVSAKTNFVIYDISEMLNIRKVGIINK